MLKTKNPKRFKVQGLKVLIKITVSMFGASLEYPITGRNTISCQYQDTEAGIEYTVRN